MPSPSPAVKLVRDLLAKFPKAATRTLSRKAWNSDGQLWKSFDACYLAFRRARGQQGKRNRNITANKDEYRGPSDNAGFTPMPKGIKSLGKWPTLKITDVGLWLVISDLHIPYHLHGAIERILKIAKARGVVGILLNGDVADCFACSRWERDPRERDFKREVKLVREFIAYLRKMFPDARIVWKWGNHEERYDIYQQSQSPITLGIDDYEFTHVMRADDAGIETVKDMRRVKIGKLSVLHGHEYRFAIQNPVSPSRGMLLRAFESVMCGHFHQTSQISQPTLSDHAMSCWSVGCLCDLRPRWMPINKWNVGGAFVRLHACGIFEVENIDWRREVNGIG